MPKRYKTLDCYHHWNPRKDYDPDWVLASDYDALAAELATWRQIGTSNAARIEGLEAALNELWSDTEPDSPADTTGRRLLGKFGIGPTAETKGEQT